MAYFIAAIPLSVGVFYKIRNYYVHQPETEIKFDVTEIPSIQTPEPIPLENPLRTLVQTSSSRSQSHHKITFTPMKKINRKYNLEFLRENAKYKTLQEFNNRGGISTLNPVISKVKNENLLIKKLS